MRQKHQYDFGLYQSIENRLSMGVQEMPQVPAHFTTGNVRYLIQIDPAMQQYIPPEFYCALAVESEFERHVVRLLDSQKYRYKLSAKLDILGLAFKRRIAISEHANHIDALLMLEDPSVGQGIVSLIDHEQGVLAHKVLLELKKMVPA